MSDLEQKQTNEVIEDFSEQIKNREKRVYTSISEATMWITWKKSSLPTSIIHITKKTIRKILHNTILIFFWKKGVNIKVYHTLNVSKRTYVYVNSQSQSIIKICTTLETKGAPALPDRGKRRTETYRPYYLKIEISSLLNFFLFQIQHLRELQTDRT